MGLSYFRLVDGLQDEPYMPHMRILSTITMVAILCAMSVLAAATPTSTTTTTVAGSTTTTLLGGCVPAASFESIICELDALVAQVSAETDLGRLKQNVVNSANKALKQATKASTGKSRVAKEQLKKCAQSLDVFRHKLSSLNARHLVPHDSRALLQSQAAGIRQDVVTLRGKL